MSSQPWSVFLGAFIDELSRLGVEDVVVSPGSRSTPLTMVFDRSSMRLWVDIDERGAAFFALGLAKASARPVCLVCTSGTAAANYFPAVCEAATARVPLLVLTADRPHELRGLGAPQTTDQIKMYGDAVVHFREMPTPDGSPEKVAFARHVARESVIRATGTPMGPVHLNFPFAEPLVPDLAAPELFSAGRRASEPALIRPARALDEDVTARLNAAFAGKRGVIVCGEGVYPREILGLARRLGFPVLADPLSNLRRYDDLVVVDNYDNIFRRQDLPPIDLVVRFGPYPVSKACFTTLGRIRPLTVVVDEVETRDFNHLADVFVRCSPAEFVASSDGLRNDIGDEYLSAWAALNDAERAKIDAVAGDPDNEGAYVMALIDRIREDSLLFSANSMAVRYLDTFYLKRAKDIHVMCNRGLSGIDGTLSSALGAAQRFDAATLLVGDLAFLHDVNALHLAKRLETNLTVVLLNNNGGGIFDMLPQRSDDPYFERLFLTPHDVDLVSVASAFGVPATTVCTPGEFAEAYEAAQSRDGIEVIEIKTECARTRERYTRYL
jgi:2-succinyl-5-enolpyruvyl-6-hydroxy-3-cyclohexene-1-carboxylate synthase